MLVINVIDCKWCPQKFSSWDTSSVQQQMPQLDFTFSMKMIANFAPCIFFPKITIFWSHYVCGEYTIILENNYHHFKSYFRNHFNWKFLLTIILMSWLFTVISLKVDDIFDYLPYPNMAVICDQGANHQFNSRWYLWDIFHILLAACNQGTTQTRQ